ncbi:synaptonemal complex protein 3-like [Nannospalax galili]|uniref:synaptonemal complex protein 3-like n=1 Tax=Nannospalax galili TaxID=1026970 RepID=UPI0004ED03E2|nr:synaptonemal complex protein 3-like [Nannospalax galili]
MQSLLAKRKQFQRILNESFQTLNEKLSHILKDEQKNREVYSEYAQLAQPLFHQWQKEVMESEKEEEKLISVAEQQCHMVLHATRVYEANFEEAKKFSVEFLQNMKVLQEKHKSLLTVAQTEVEKEMEKSKENLMIETQNQDVAAVENGHQSLLSESCEERT